MLLQSDHLLHQKRARQSPENIIIHRKNGKFSLNDNNMNNRAKPVKQDRAPTTTTTTTTAKIVKYLYTSQQKKERKKLYDTHNNRHFIIS
jgi:hypothetical protein